MTTLCHWKAHENAISKILFNPDGTSFITSSIVANSFHVWETPTSSNLAYMTPNWLYKLERGYTPAQVLDIAFSPDSKWVAVSTAKGTIHLYYVPPDPESLIKNEGLEELIRENRLKEDTNESCLVEALESHVISSSGVMPFSVYPVTRIKYSLDLGQAMSVCFLGHVWNPDHNSRHRSSSVTSQPGPMKWNLFGEETFEVLFRQRVMVYDSRKLNYHAIDLGLKREEKSKESKQPSPNLGTSIEDRLKSFGLMRPSSKLCVKTSEMDPVSVAGGRRCTWKAEIVPVSYDVTRSIPVYFVQTFGFWGYVDDEWSTGKKRRVRKKSDELESWKGRFDTRDLPAFEPFVIHRVEKKKEKKKESSPSETISIPEMKIIPGDLPNTTSTEFHLLEYEEE